MRQNSTQASTNFIQIDVCDLQLSGGGNQQTINKCFMIAYGELQVVGIQRDN